MSDVFAEALHARKHEIFHQVLQTKNHSTARLTRVSYCRELACLKGRPDFVALPVEPLGISKQEWATLARALATPSLALTLALLHRDAPHTEEYLFRSTGLSLPTFRRVLSTLESLGMITPVRTSSYVLSHACPHVGEWEFWAFELKIDQWRRALYQAYQYQAFASRAVVVISQRWAHRIEPYRDQFEKRHVGVLALDDEHGVVHTIIPPRKRTPSSRWHYLYALGKFLSRRAIVAERPVDEGRGRLGSCFVPAGPDQTALQA